MTGTRTVHWAGCHETHQHVRRPVHKLATTGDKDAIMAAIGELRRQGLTAKRIADQLNADGWLTPTQRNSFNERLVRAMMYRYGRAARGPKPPPQRRRERLVACRPRPRAEDAPRDPVWMGPPWLGASATNRRTVGRDRWQCRVAAAAPAPAGAPHADAWERLEKNVTGDASCVVDHYQLAVQAVEHGLPRCCLRRRDDRSLRPALSYARHGRRFLASKGIPGPRRAARQGEAGGRRVCGSFDTDQEALIPPSLDQFRGARGKSPPRRRGHFSADRRGHFSADLTVVYKGESYRSRLKPKLDPESPPPPMPANKTKLPPRARRR